MKGQRLWTILLLTGLLIACRPKATPQAPTVTLVPIVSPTSLPSPTAFPSPTPTSPPFPTPTFTPSPEPVTTSDASSIDMPSMSSWPPLLILPYTPTDDDSTGTIRGSLSFPSEFIPSLAVYAVATDGSRFYRVDTETVPPGEPSYEIPAVEPGTYYVYGYPTEGSVTLGGAYSYLTACEAGHYPPPAEGCWENPQYDLAPVEVKAGQAVEEINIFDWYSPSVPPPPDGPSS